MATFDPEAELRPFIDAIKSSLSLLDSAVSGATASLAGSLQAMVAPLATAMADLSQGMAGVSTSVDDLRKSVVDASQSISQSPKRGGGAPRQPRRGVGGMLESFGEASAAASRQILPGLGKRIGEAIGAAVGGVRGFQRAGLPGAVMGGQRGAAQGARQGGFAGVQAGELAAKGAVLLGDTFSTLAGFGSMLAGSLMKLSAVATLFVAAFNPALVETFLLTMKDLVAVFGAGLQPIVTALTLVMRGLADSVVPVIEGLMPAFNALGEAVMTFLIPVFDGLVRAVTALTPTINSFMSTFSEFATQLGEAFGNAIVALIPVVQIFMRSLQALLVVLNPLIQAISGLAQYVVPFLGSAMLAFGALISTTVVAAIWTFTQAMIESAVALRAQIAAGAASAASQGLIGTVIAAVAGLNPLTLAITGLVAVVGGLAAFLMTRQNEQGEGFGMTGASAGAAARKAEYTTVDALSKNLIKAGFSGSANDRLKSIDVNIRRQLEIMEKQQARGPGLGVVGGRAPGAAV